MDAPPQPVIETPPRTSAASSWPTPDAIVVDARGERPGYGFGTSRNEIGHWYRPYVAVWSTRAAPGTTLWFWESPEIWPEIHALLNQRGWDYRGCNFWIGGGEPVACVQYVRRDEQTITEEAKTLREWMREEWERSGLPFDAANDACGVAEAGSRKYLGTDKQWYPPPPEMFEKLVDYANTHGDPDGRPYFSRDGEEPLTGDEWLLARPDSRVAHHSTFNLDSGVTNVWAESVASHERPGAEWPTDPHQKPELVCDRLIQSSTTVGDTVWEPFGRSATASVVAARRGRQPCLALSPPFAEYAESRLGAVSLNLPQEAEREQTDLDAFV